MDFLTIAATVVATALVPLFKTVGTKALEEVGKKTGEEVFEKRQTILEKVKELFVGGELITLELLEEFPDNQDLQKKVTEKLEAKLKENPEIAKSLEQINQRIVKIKNIDITKSKLLNRIRVERGEVEVENEKIIESEIINDVETS